MFGSLNLSFLLFFLKKNFNSGTEFRSSGGSSARFQSSSCTICGGPEKELLLAGICHGWVAASSRCRLAGRLSHCQWQQPCLRVLPIYLSQGTAHDIARIHVPSATLYNAFHSH